MLIRPLVLAALCAIALPAATQEAQLVRMGTASLAGAYFPVGVALCRLVNEDRRDHGIRCAAQPSGGSVANIRALHAGEISLALVQSDVQDAALNGTGPFAGVGPFPDQRALFSLYPEPLTVVARADAGIATLDDLAGKRISPGPPESGQRELWNVLAASMGWNAESFESVLDLAPTEQALALCEGEIDAFVIAIGHPAPTVREATSGCDARLVPVTGPAVASLVASNPFFGEVVIPGRTYRGNPAPVPTFGVLATLVTRADVADEIISTLVGTTIGKLSILQGLDPVLADLSPAEMAATGLTAPLHPAAEAEFRALEVLR